jgi:hypothetical protein
MKFSEWLSEEDIIFEITINPNDSDVRKMRRGRWEIRFDDNVYHFIAEPVTLMDGAKGFIVQWGLLTADGSLTTELVGSTKNMIRLFSKIGTCMLKFIEDENPNAFVMYSNKKLAKIYDTMWGKFSQTEPFNRYFFRDRRSYKKLDGEDMYAFHYYRKVDDYMNESQWEIVLDLFRKEVTQ